MISFIIAFASKGDNLHDWKDTDGGMIILSTILAIKNINKIIDIDKEIILVDNTNSFPDIKMPNLKIVKGIQYLTGDKLTDDIKRKYNIDDVVNLTMWVSNAFNVGIEHAKGDYIVLQHNDVFYHQNLLPNLLNSLTGYLGNKDIIDSLDINIEVGYENGGYIKQTLFGMADAYFFLCKKEFFNDYSVDWGYGDTNHGATIKCLLAGKSFLHIGPFFGNANYNTDTSNTYVVDGKDFITHLKGGFSEHSMSFKLYKNNIMLDNANNYLEKIVNSV